MSGPPAQRTHTRPSWPSEAWLSRLASIPATEIDAVLVVQLGLDWLRPEHTALRNTIDEKLTSAPLLRRTGRLRIQRLVLHNVPVRDADGRPTAGLSESFREWQQRMAAASALLYGSDGLAPQVHRLIVNGDRFSAPVPDMVEVRENGQWSDPVRVSQALELLGTPGATTPLTGYDVNWDGPFGDADPSVHL